MLKINERKIQDTRIVVHEILYRTNINVNHPSLKTNFKVVQEA